MFCLESDIWNIVQKQKNIGITANLKKSKIIKFVKAAMVNKFCVIACEINLVNEEKGPVFSQRENEVFGR